MVFKLEFFSWIVEKTTSQWRHNVTPSLLNLAIPTYRVLSTSYIVAERFAWLHTNLLRKKHSKIAMEPKRWSEKRQTMQSFLKKSIYDCKASLEIVNLRPTLYCNTSLLQKLWYSMHVPQPHATVSHDHLCILFDNRERSLRRRSWPSSIP